MNSFIQKNVALLLIGIQTIYASEQLNGQSEKAVPLVKNTHFNGTSVENAMWNLLSAYSPDGYIIIDDYLKAPFNYGTCGILGGNSGFTKYIDGKSEHEIVKSANTVVHEMCHSYTNKLFLKFLKESGEAPTGCNYLAIYLGNHHANVVKISKSFPAKEIDAIFPDNLKTDRYKTYILPSKEI